jgi:hypothetical protein
MGAFTPWKLHSQGRIHSTGKISNSAKRPHLDNSLEIKILAQNLHVPMAPSSKQNPNLG